MAGGQISRPAAQSTRAYEFAEYDWLWRGEAWLPCAGNTEADARAHFWELCRDRVEADLADYAEDGWEPDNADLTQAVRFRAYRFINRGRRGGCLFVFLYFLLGEGVGLLLGHALSTWNYAAIGYRLRLRRPRRPGEPSRARNFRQRNRRH